MMEQKFSEYFKKFTIPMSAELNPVNMLVDEATKAEWNNEGLPTDVVSIENGTILVNSARYPLMIDPQLQGITWIKEKLKSQGVIAMRIGSKNYVNKIERAIEDGSPVLLENLEEYIDPIIFPIIARKIVKKGGKVFMDFGGKKLDLHPDFRLYM